MFDLDHCTTCISPKLRQIDVNDNAHFECLSDGEVHWIFNGGPIKNYAFTFGNMSKILMIKEAKAKHSGKYTCVGTTIDGGLEFYANAELQVWGNFYC